MTFRAPVRDPAREKGHDSKIWSFADYARMIFWTGWAYEILLNIN